MSELKHLFCSTPFSRAMIYGHRIVRPAGDVTGRNFFRPAGDVYMCCWLKTSAIGNIQHQSVEEVWNSQKAQEIRHSILDGSFKYCSRDGCPYLQTVSYEVQQREAVKDKELRDIIERELTILPYGPREILCGYDRSCNLSCPSCRTGVLVENDRREEILAIQSKLQNEALKDAHDLIISGEGDPFGSPFYRRWIQTMTRWNMPHLIKITLHTNAQLWTPEMWSTIPTEIQELVKSTIISIDAATEKTYSINRRGGDFENLLKNLEFISGLRTHGPLQHLKMSMVVQSNNFMEMIAFIDLGKRYNADVVSFSKIMNWGTFSEREYKDRAIHLPKHPRHSEYIDILNNETFNDPIVFLGNLSEIY
jgi:MoaA/NifB/PqqE/SkfB family radical SAM enzyme